MHETLCFMRKTNGALNERMKTIQTMPNNGGALVGILLFVPAVFFTAVGVILGALVILAIRK